VKLRADIVGISSAQKCCRNFGINCAKGMAIGVGEMSRSLNATAVWNAPIKIGFLRSRMTAFPAKRYGLRVTSYVGTVGVHYAFKMHEGFYNLGPRSAMQPPTAEGARQLGAK